MFGENISELCRVGAAAEPLGDGIHIISKVFSHKQPSVSYL
jgi:hypothetical protein